MTFIDLLRADIPFVIVLLSLAVAAFAAVWRFGDWWIGEYILPPHRKARALPDDIREKLEDGVTIADLHRLRGEAIDRAEKP